MRFPGSPDISNDILWTGERHEQDEKAPLHRTDLHLGLIGLKNYLLRITGDTTLPRFG